MVFVCLFSGSNMLTRSYIGMAPKKGTKRQKTSRPSTSTTRNVLSSQPYAIEKKGRLEDKEFLNSHYLDWSVMTSYGLSDTLQNLIEDKRWFKVFDMKEPAYKNLTIEVLSTIKWSKDDEDDDDDEDSVAKFTFQAYGEVKEVPLRKLGVYLGYYEEGENDNLPTNWPDGATQESLWAELIHPSTADFNPSKSLNSHFVRTEHKLLHNIIAHTLTCRKSSHSKLTTFDMFLLYSIIKNYQIDLGVEVANFILRQSEDVRTKGICCGGYITQLLKGMGQFQEPVNDTKVEAMKISPGPFRSWGLTKVPRGVQQPLEAPILPEIQPTEARIDQPSSSSAPVRLRPSSSSSFSVEDSLSRVEFDLKELNENFKQEKKKNKRFRSKLFNMLKSAISCFNPDAAQTMEYDTSEESSSDSDLES